MKILLTLTLMAFIATATAQRNDCRGDCFCPTTIQDRCLDAQGAGTCVIIGPAPVTQNIRMPASSCLVIADNTVMQGNIISTSSTFDRTSHDCVIIGANVVVNGRINLKGGEDYVSVGTNSRVTGTIKMGTEADCLVASDATVGKVDMGSENDYIFAAGLDVRNANFMPQDVVLGAGDDCMEVIVNKKRSSSKKQIVLNHFRDIYAGNGNDDIRLNTVDMRTLWGWNGDDCFNLNDIRFYRVLGESGNDNIRVDNWDSTLVLTPSLNHIDSGRDIDRIDATNYNGINTPSRVDGGRNSAICCTDPDIERGRNCGPCIPLVPP